jgi:hypothetical protein
MRAGWLLLTLAGCNALFGLEPAQLGGDGGATVDADPGAPDAGGIPGIVFGLSKDYTQDGSTVQHRSGEAFFGATDCERVAEAGLCFARSCVPTDPVIPADHAGTITIEGDLALVDLVPDPEGLYPRVDGFDGRLFNAGITVGVYSTGGDIPAFSSTLTAPSTITFTTPMPLSIQRAQGLELAWPAVDDGTVWILVVDNAGTTVSCEFPASAGAGAIPTDVLAELQAGFGTFTGYVINRDVALAGDYRVTNVVAQVTRRPDGDWATGTVALE